MTERAALLPLWCATAGCPSLGVTTIKAGTTWPVVPVGEASTAALATGVTVTIDADVAAVNVGMAPMGRGQGTAVD
jgi:hypothetical protein